MVLIKRTLSTGNSSRRPGRFIIPLVLSLCLSGGYHLFYTTAGAAWVSRLVARIVLGAPRMTVDRVQGSLAGSFTSTDIELRELQFFPAGTVVKIERLQTVVGVGGPIMTVHNGRVLLPDLETVYFYGTYSPTQISMMVYAKTLTADQLGSYGFDATVFGRGGGVITDIELLITGPPQKPQVQGPFMIERLWYRDFSMTRCQGMLDVYLIPGEPIRALGEISLRGGVVRGKKTAAITLLTGTIVLRESTVDPQLDIKGTATVEGVDVSLSVGGSFMHPQVDMRSYPDLAPETIGLMLVTNRRWKGIGDAASPGTVPANLAKDLLDYFVLSDVDGELSRYLHKTDISVHMEEGKRAVGVSAPLSDRVDANYSIEVTGDRTAPQETTQKIGGEYKITDKVSLGAEKELPREQQSAAPAKKADDKVLLKFKTGF